MTPRVLDVIGRILSGSPSEKLRLKELHSKAREVITALGNSLSAEDVTDKVRLSVLRKILFNSGNLQYEKKTGKYQLSAFVSVVNCAYTVLFCSCIMVVCSFKNLDYSTVFSNLVMKLWQVLT